MTLIISKTIVANPPISKQVLLELFSKIGSHFKQQSTNQKVKDEIEAIQKFINTFSADPDAMGRKMQIYAFVKFFELARLTESLQNAIQVKKQDHLLPK